MQHAIANHTFFTPYVIEKNISIKQTGNSDLINSISSYFFALYENPLLLPNDIYNMTSFPGNRLNAEQYHPNRRSLYPNITRVDYCTHVDSMCAENPIPQAQNIVKIRSEFYNQESLLKALNDYAKS